MLLRTAEECQVVDRDVDEKLLAILLSCLLDQLAERQELAVESLALLSLLLFLLQLVHVVEFAGALEIEVFCRNT